MEFVFSLKSDTIKGWRHCGKALVSYFASVVFSRTIQPNHPNLMTRIQSNNARRPYAVMAYSRPGGRIGHLTYGLIILDRQLEKSSEDAFRIFPGLFLWMLFFIQPMFHLHCFHFVFITNISLPACNFKNSSLSVVQVLALGW